MLYGLYLSAAGLQAEEYRQAVTSNNLANAQTNGFKRDLALIQSRPNATLEDPQMARYRVPVLSDQGGGVFASPTAVDLAQSTILNTNNKTDLALQGPGFFTVSGDKPGDKLLTRDGQFLIDPSGKLVTAGTGRKVLDANGQPVTVTPELPLQISPTGDVIQAGTTLATLGILNVKDPRALKKVGENNLTAPADALEPIGPATQVKQSAVETSGVDSMTEMVNMMEGQRAFEANAKMITYQDTMLSELNSIGRIA